MKHESRIDKMDFCEEFETVYNRFKPERGIVLNFKTIDGTVSVKLMRNTAITLGYMLENIELDYIYPNGDKTIRTTCDIQNGI